MRVTCRRLDGGRGPVQSGAPERRSGGRASGVRRALAPEDARRPLFAPSPVFRHNYRARSNGVRYNGGFAAPPRLIGKPLNGNYGRLVIAAAAVRDRAPRRR